MGERSYPPLTQSEMREILKALGFSLDRSNKHPVWVRPADEKLIRRVVPLDDYSQFEQKLIKRIIQETGFSRVEFYCATEKTAKKIRR
jgi:predicted RNA binding protein YcfA (HicA-like mRNA interferase family)